MEFTKDIYFNTNPTVNEDLTITYNGFLGNSQELSIVYGYGEAWENTTETKMEKTENGFIGTISLLNYDTLNFCFKNSNGEWDNNSYCNYITEIAPAVNQANNFDIDALIEELLFEPVIEIEENTKNEDFTTNLVNSTTTIPELELISEIENNNEPSSNEFVVSEIEKNIDLAYQLSNLMAEVEPSNTELEEFSTLDEILTATKIETTDNADNTEQTTSNITEENNAIFEDFINNLSSITSKHEDTTQNTVETEQTNNIETSLSTTSDSYIVSSRQASKFYLFKKRIKLALYKAFVKIPKMLLGIEDKEN